MEEPEITVSKQVIQGQPVTFSVKPINGAESYTIEVYKDDGEWGTRIERFAFANCSNLQYFNLPDSLTYIAPDAFEGCDNLFIECSAGSLGEEFARAHGFYPVIK